MAQINENELVQNLLELDEDELTAQLGVRAQNIEANPRAASIDSLEESAPVPRGAWDEVLKLGQNYFDPVNAQAYKILCSPIGGDGELAKELDKLMNEKTTEAAAKATTLLTPVLVGSLGLPQSLAVLAGTLIVKKIAKGFSDFTCENWKTSLEASSTNTPDDPVTPTEVSPHPPETPAS